MAGEGFCFLAESTEEESSEEEAVCLMAWGDKRKPDRESGGKGKARGKGDAWGKGKASGKGKQRLGASGKGISHYSEHGKGGKTRTEGPRQGPQWKNDSRK